MSLFSKTEISPEMIPFINAKKGVGVVKVKDYGEASARIESHKLILESYGDEYPIIEPISAIKRLSYNPGNFFQEPKLAISYAQKEYTLAGVDNNDDELEAFYKTILHLKTNEKSQKTMSDEDILDEPLDEEDFIDEFDNIDDVDTTSNRSLSVKKSKKEKSRVMSLFSKTETNPEMIPFINAKKGVGIVDIENYGEASARIESQNLIMESYDGKAPIVEQLSAIKSLSYDEGNFFQDSQLIIGYAQREYVLSEVDNNDELENFYKTILDFKTKEKQERNNLKNNSSEKSYQNINIDELDEIEEEFNIKNKNEKVNKIKNFISRHHEQSDDLESLLDEDDFLANKSSNKSEIVLDEDDDEEINLTNELNENIDNKSEIKEIQELDELDEFDEIDDFGELKSYEDDDLIILEEDDDELGFEETLESTQQKIETESQPESELQPNLQTEVQAATSEQEITKDKDLSQEISQVKEQVNGNINDLNQEINKQTSQNQDNFDPAYQIRRYYELKEDGIITEEEFELKKKQLLNL